MSAASCLLLDVGQGTATVVLLGGQHAIVIDGGRSSRVARQVLDDNGVTSIEAIVVSHNDDDHAKGIPGIVRRYLHCIKRVHYLHDRPLSKIEWMNTLERHLSVEDFETFKTKRRRLEVPETGTGAWRLWPPDMKASDTELILFFPDFGANEDAQKKSDSNATSAVVKFRHGRRSVLLGADAPEKAWKQIHAQNGGAVPCDVLGAPHHGGLLFRAPAGDDEDERYDREVARFGELFSKYFHVREGVVISVGTTNGYEHPRRAYVHALDDGPQVFCTQLTGRCCDDPGAERPGLLDPTHYREYASASGLAFDAIDSNPRDDVGCAGTVVVNLTTQKAEIVRADEHRGVVGSLSRNRKDGVLCRARGGTPRPPRHS